MLPKTILAGRTREALASCFKREEWQQEKYELVLFRGRKSFLPPKSGAQPRTRSPGC